MKAFLILKITDVNVAVTTLRSEIFNARIRAAGNLLHLPLDSSMQTMFMYRIAKCGTYNASLVAWNAKESVLDQMMKLSCVLKVVKIDDNLFDDLKAASDEYAKVKTNGKQKLQTLHTLITDQVKEMFV